MPQLNFLVKKRKLTLCDSNCLNKDEIYWEESVVFLFGLTRFIQKLKNLCHKLHPSTSYQTGSKLICYQMSKCNDWHSIDFRSEKYERCVCQDPSKKAALSTFVLQVIRFAEELFDVRLAFLSHHLRGNTFNMPAEAKNDTISDNDIKLKTFD